MLVVLSGGTGTPKLLDGLSELLPPRELCIIANSADDFYFYGLRVCPDIDSVLYGLANCLDKTKWWGIKGDTFGVRQALQEFIEDIWFNLGDKDLAMCLLRTNLLTRGNTLSEATDILRERLGVKSLVLPMTDDLVQTFISTPEGRMHLQEWFVRYKGRPDVLSIDFDGSNEAIATERVIESIQAADAVIIGPSNPITSIGPILAISQINETLQAIDAPILAISPFVGSKPISGPAGTFLRARNLPVHSKVLLKLYGEFLDVLLVDPQDVRTIKDETERIQIVGRDTLMASKQDRITVAKEVLCLLREF